MPETEGSEFESASQASARRDAVLREQVEKTSSQPEPRPVNETGKRKRRRAQLAAPEGSDPSPENPVKQTRASAENDERLRQDRPPHWG